MRCRVAVAYVNLLLVFVSAAAAPVVDEYSILSLQHKDTLGKLVLSDSHLDISHPHKISGGPKLDCLSQRIKSLARKNDGDLLIYVPVCSMKNTTLYQSVQCHETSKYCWCVHVRTGEPIPGSTTFIDKPRCIEEKPIKKKERRKERCIGQRRTRFLRRLSSSLKTEMIMAVSGNKSHATVSRETAIQWKFAQLDKNKNKLLERVEWKPYKAQLLQWKRVRRCSRNLFKTCDVDRNKRLTPSEWKQCIAPVSEINRVPAKRPEQLNPFLYVLKTD